LSFVESSAFTSLSFNGSIFARYDLKFTQGDDVIYEGDQSAIWTRIEADATSG